MKVALHKTFENWETTILRPIVTNLSTGAIVFLLALLNGQFRDLVFPPAVVKGYPLICRAEPYTTTGGELAVDFFIINRDDRDYTREELSQFLTEHKPDPTSLATPSIQLDLTRSVGTIASASTDATFNGGKGELNTSVGKDGRRVTIDIERIRTRAVMKVLIVFSGITDKPVNRMNAGAVPVSFNAYLDACYQR